MTTNHIDQLTDWWETAEQGAIGKGDTVIIKVDGGYAVETSDFPEPDPSDEVRILARAPKPKPAWHDAVAVIASNVNTERQVWERYMGSWCGTAGDEVDAEDLTDVVPLIEAKVTDDMVERIREASRDGRVKDSYWNVDGYYRAILTAALGIEAE